MIAKEDLARRIREYPGDRTESDWLDTFEFLRCSLAESLATDVQLGCYSIDDFPGYASAGGGARVRGRGPVPGIKSDCWEGILGWSGNRGSQGHAGASIFPFQGGFVVQPRGALVDLGANAETDQLLAYRFENGKFVNSGWVYGDGPGEWAHVSVPGTVYFQLVPIAQPNTEYIVDEPIAVDLHMPELSVVSRAAARVSLVHVNRDRECTNLVPWTSRPPKSNSPHTQSLSDCSSPTPNSVRVRLDLFSIRGGWKPGRYHMTIRVQNFHEPDHWAWTSDISEPFKITIIDNM